MKTFIGFSARFFLLLLLLSHFSDALKITAYVGQTVLLPCRITLSGDLPTVEWSKEGLSPNITFLYRDGCETFAEKHPVFHNRTSLALNKLKDGDLSQIIHDLRLSDAGVYQCMTLRRRQAKVEAMMELFVAAVSEPKLTFVPAADNGVKLQCRAECWFPQPELTFLDDQGEEIKADHPHGTEESAGCFTVIKNVTLQTATKKVTCRAQVSQIKQIRDADLYIPDRLMASCTTEIVISVLVTLALCVCGLVCQYCINNLKQQDDVGRLKRENEQLKKDISKLKTDLKSQPRPAPPCDQRSKTSTSTSNRSKQVNLQPQSNKLTPAVSSTSVHQESDHKPKMKDSKSAVSRPNLVPSPQKKENRAKDTPCPSINDGSTLFSRPPAATSEGIGPVRSQSFSLPNSGSFNSTRRYTMPNRFSVLSEDSESLLNDQ